MQIALFHEHYKVRYLPRGLTAWIFYIICLLVVIVIPFIVGLAMQNFWIENNYFYHVPDISFTGRVALRVSTVQQREYLWTSSNTFNTDNIEGTSLEVFPHFTVYRGGEFFEFIITVPLNDLGVSLYGGESGSSVGVPPDTVLDSVREATLLPEFIYTIDSSRIKLNMTAAPLLTYRRTPNSYNTLVDNTTVSFSGGPVCALLEGDVNFHSTDRLISSPYVHYTRAYTSSPFLQYVTQAGDLYDLSQFAAHYTSRNQSLTVRPYVQAVGGLELLAEGGPTEEEDLDLLNAFTWRIKLRVAPAVVRYAPSYREVLKWAWIQYFIIAYVIQWFMWKIRGFIVTLGLLDVTAIYHARKVI